MKNAFLEKIRRRLKQWLARYQPYQKKLLAWWQPWQKKLHTWTKPRLEQLQARWQSLNPRERYAALGGGITAGLLLFYALIWSPLNTHLDDLRTRIAGEKKTAAWMQAADQELRSLEERQSKLPFKQLSQRINAVQEDLRQAPLGKSLTQLSQSAPDEIHIVFDQVNFDELVAGVIAFSQQHHLTVKQAAVKRMNGSGLVQAEFVFKVGN